MAADWTMTFTGAQQLTDNLRRLSEALTREVLLEALTTAAEPMARRMSDLAPRGPDAPHLADSMVIQPAKSDAEEARVLVGPSKDFYYGWFWEFGWKFHVARPFMRPAFEEMSKIVLERLGARLWLVIAREAERGVPQQDIAA
jgi:HK97 gp10 family phage protein